MHFSVVHLALVTGILISLVKLSSLRHWITLALLLCCGDGLWETAWMRPKEHLCISGRSSRILLLRCVCKSGPSLGSLPVCSRLGLPGGAWMRASLPDWLLLPLLLPPPSQTSSLLPAQPLVACAPELCPSSWSRRFIWRRGVSGL